MVAGDEMWFRDGIQVVKRHRGRSASRPRRRSGLASSSRRRCSSPSPRRNRRSRARQVSFHRRLSMMEPTEIHRRTSMSREWHDRPVADASEARFGQSLGVDAARGRLLVEESREAVVVLDETGRVLAASRRARQSIEGVHEGARIPDSLLAGEAGRIPLVVPYVVDGRRERLVYLTRGRRSRGVRGAAVRVHRRGVARAADAARAAVDAARDRPPPRRGGSSRRPGAARGRADRRADRRGALPQRARVRARVVSLGAAAVLPGARARSSTSSRSARPARASRSGSRATRRSSCRVRPRMLRVVAQNLAENSIRYAGRARRSRCRSSGTTDGAVLRAPTTAAASTRPSCRGSSSASTAPTARVPRAAPGLGLAIVKHVVTPAGGTVEARGGKGAGSRSAASSRASLVHQPFTARSPCSSPMRRTAGKTGLHVPAQRLWTAMHPDRRRDALRSTSRIAELDERRRRRAGREVVFEVEDLAVTYGGSARARRRRRSTSARTPSRRSSARPAAARAPSSAASTA